MLSMSNSTDQARYRVQVTYRPIFELKLDPRNPRRHSPKQIRQIARSMEAFGFVVPVLVDSDGKVIAGHGRVLACRLLGWTEVPTICLSHLSEGQAKALAIADNRLTENSVWDDRLLGQQFKDLSELELDFSLEVTGFEIGEIDLRIQGLALDDSPEATDSADELDRIATGPLVSRPGDLFLLGDKHRIGCASALEQDSFSKLMGAELAAMVFSDPPYNVAIEGNVSGLGAIRHPDFAMASGEMNPSEFLEFLVQALSLLARHTLDVRVRLVHLDRQRGLHMTCMQTGDRHLRLAQRMPQPDRQRPGLHRDLSSSWRPPPQDLRDRLRRRATVSLPLPLSLSINYTHRGFRLRYVQPYILFHRFLPLTIRFAHHRRPPHQSDQNMWFMTWPSRASNQPSRR